MCTFDDCTIHEINMNDKYHLQQFSSDVSYIDI